MRRRDARSIPPAGNRPGRSASRPPRSGSRNWRRASSEKPSHSGPRQIRRTGVSPYSSRTSSGTKREDICSDGAMLSHANRAPPAGCFHRIQRGVHTCAPKPSRSKKAAPDGHITPNSGAKCAKRDFSARRNAKILPGWPFALNVRPNNRQLGRISTRNLAPVKQKLQDRCSLVVSNQQIGPPSRCEIHGTAGRNAKALPTASSKILKRQAGTGCQTSRMGVIETAQRDNSSTGKKLYRITLPKQEGLDSSAIPRLSRRKDLDVRPPDQPPSARRGDAINPSVLAANRH